ncbi:MAG: hypothetical protein U5K69_20875 [Balneolaceae bacterium]|nr:hypothetical protein [Balneolaceae bacterium]
MAAKIRSGVIIEKSGLQIDSQSLCTTRLNDSISDHDDEYDDEKGHHGFGSAFNAVADSPHNNGDCSPHKNDRKNSIENTVTCIGYP